MCLFDVGCYDADESSIYRREVRRSDLSHHHAFAEETTATDEIFREELEDNVVDVGDSIKASILDMIIDLIEKV